MTKNKYDVIIIGAGPAGLCAGIYLARYKLKTLIIDSMPGGLAKDAHKVENYPGFESITGLDLMEKIKNHTLKSGAEIEYDNVIDINKQNDKFVVKTNSNEFYSDYLIIATGSKRKKLGIPGEDKLYGRGISYCATCDAAFFKNKEVAVIGGANAAVMASVLLSKYASKVYLIYRKDKLRAEPVWVDRIIGNDKIQVMYNTNVKQAMGENKLTAIELDNGNEIDVSGLFIEIGSMPSVDMARRLGVKLDNKDRIIVAEDLQTNVQRVYAAGDITTGSNGFQQIVTAMSEGSIAAYSIFKEHKKRNVDYK